MAIETKDDVRIEKLLENIRDKFEEELSKLRDRLYAEINNHRRSCEICDHWSGGKCSLVNQVPPPHVLFKGCEKFSDEIPF